MQGSGVRGQGFHKDRECLLLLCMVLGLEPRVFCILSKHSTVELNSQPQIRSSNGDALCSYPSVFVVRVGSSAGSRVRCSCHLPLLPKMRLRAIRDAGPELWKMPLIIALWIWLADTFWEMLVSVTGKTEERNAVQRVPCTQSRILSKVDDAVLGASLEILLDRQRFKGMNEMRIIEITLPKLQWAQTWQNGEVFLRRRGKKIKPKQNRKYFRDGRKKKKNQIPSVWNPLETNLFCNVFVF